MTVGRFLTCGLFALACTAQAQQPTPSPSPTPPVFKVGTSVVHVDAVVTDGRGRQVTDLQAGDFEIETDGKRLPVALSSYVPLVRDGTSASGPAGSLRPEQVSRAIAFVYAFPVVEFHTPSPVSVNRLERNMQGARLAATMLDGFVD